MRRCVAVALLGVVTLLACEASPPAVEPRSPPAPPPPPTPVVSVVVPPPKPQKMVKLEDVGLDSTALDRNVNPCDDFYQFACGGWMAKTQIPDDKSKWGRSFSEIADRTEQDLRKILEGS